MTPAARSGSKASRPLRAPGRPKEEGTATRPLRASSREPAAPPAPAQPAKAKRRRVFGSTRALTVIAIVLTFVVMVLILGVAVLGLRPDAEPTTIAGRGIRNWTKQVEATGSAEAYTGLGEARLAAGHEGRARTAFENALKVDPHAWQAARELGVLLAKSDPERARELLTQSAKDAPRGNKAGSYLALGDLEADEGEKEAAKAAYEDAVADNPFLVQARLSLARALEALGDTDGALEQYREAIRFDPSEPTATEAIERLEAAQTEETEETGP